MENKIKVIVFLFLFLFPVVISAQQESNKGDIATNITEKRINRLNLISEKEVTVPLFISLPFGISEEKIELKDLILVLCISLMLFIIFYNIFQIFPFFENRLMVFIASLSSTLILSVTGAIFESVKAFYDFLFFFDFLEKWPILSIILSLSFLYLFFKGALKLISWIKKDEKLTSARLLGVKVGIGLNSLGKKLNEEM